jgi:hypothetical protein
MPVSFTSHNVRLDEGSQFDGLGTNIAFEMTEGSYRTSARSTFISMKTAYVSDTAPAVTPGLRQA